MSKLTFFFFDIFAFSFSIFFVPFIFFFYFLLFCWVTLASLFNEVSHTIKVKVSPGKFNLRKRGRNQGISVRPSVCVCVYEFH